MAAGNVVPAKPRVRSTEVEQHFPTVILSRQYAGTEAMNELLTSLVLRLETEARNVAPETSTVGGFQTDNDLLTRSEPEIVMLRQMIQETLQEYLAKLFKAEGATRPRDFSPRLWGWGVSMREGDINTQHVHPNAKVSGVYYVSMPPVAAKAKNKLKPEGAIIFVDPRPRAQMNRLPNQTTDVTVPPEPGQLIMFPSYYEHFVLPFRGPGVRICIAFNVAF